MDEILSKVKNALLSMQRLSWEQGLAAQAFFECGDTHTGILLCLEAIHRRIPEGVFSIGANAGLSAEPGSCGAPMLIAYRETNEPMFLRAAQTIYGYYSETAARNRDGIAYCYSREDPESFWEKPFRIRTSALYHIAPFLAAFGKPNEAVNQVQAYQKTLYDLEKKLYRQSWNDETRSFDDKSFRSEATGWAAAAIACLLHELPAGAVEERNVLSGHFRELTDSVLLYQKNDGMFCSVLDEPESPPDCAASCMIAYAVLRAVSDGILDKVYKNRAVKTMETLIKRADQYGIIKNPLDAESKTASVAAQAFFLLAAAISS